MQEAALNEATSLTLLACQISIPPTTLARERDAHVARTSQAIETAAEGNTIDLVVLPELSTIDYSRDAFEQLEMLAEPLDGPSFGIFSALARKLQTHIVYGVPRTEGGGFRISQVVVDPTGSYLTHFDKLHLAQYGASMEKEYFERGDRLAMFEIKGLRIAPIICYDIRIPELTRTLCYEHGVQLILHCGAYYQDESWLTWRDFVITRAMENQIFMLSLNRAGEHYGGSMFCPPWVDENNRELRFGEDETFRKLVVDPCTISSARKNYSFLTDRLPDYSKLHR